MQEDLRAREFRLAAGVVEKELAALRKRGGEKLSGSLLRLQRLFANLRGERLAEPGPWHLVYVSGGFRTGQNGSNGLVRLDPMVAFELAGPLSRAVRGVAVRPLDDALESRCTTCRIFSSGTYVVRCGEDVCTLCLRCLVLREY